MNHLSARAIRRDWLSEIEARDKAKEHLEQCKERLRIDLAAYRRAEADLFDSQKELENVEREYAELTRVVDIR